jgi:hypothetical protein
MRQQFLPWGRSGLADTFQAEQWSMDQQACTLSPEALKTNYDPGR